MKRIKHLLLGLIAVFALVASSMAYEGVTTNYDVLTISATVTTNAPDITKNGVTKYTVITAKFATKDLLSLFANWVGPWPAGAKLVQAWDEPWNGDVLVVDKTGTNVLFDASSDYNPDLFFTVDFFSGQGAYTGTDNSSNPGFYDYTWFNNGSFTLVDDFDSTFLSGNGPNTEVFSQKWDKNGNYSTWSDSEKCTASGAGSDEELNGVPIPATVKVEISAKGKGAGENYIYYLYLVI